jgi:MOSC domain-containing protein YiiM
VETARAGPLGLEGDGHRDTEHHGGFDRALCLYSLERIRALQAEGHPVGPGSLGENLTLEGLDWSQVVPGARLRLGDAVVVEVTGYASPCLNIRPAFADGNYARVSQKRHPGDSRVYARVLRTGPLRPGDPARLVSRGEAEALLTPRP